MSGAKARSQISCWKNLDIYIINWSIEIKRNSSNFIWVIISKYEQEIFIKQDFKRWKVNSGK